MADVSDQGSSRVERPVRAGEPDTGVVSVPGSFEPESTAADPSLVGVLAELERAGWTGQFMAVAGALIRCLTCRTDFPADEAAADQVRRLEGASDPADMVIVVLLICPSCATRGTLTAHYGPEASGEESDVVAALARTPAPGPGDGDRPGTTS